jgi:hypothetical protein
VGPAGETDDFTGAAAGQRYIRALRNGGQNGLWRSSSKRDKLSKQ